MKTTTLQLLPTTSHGTPSGNYDGSSLDFDGVQQQAANYYGGFGSLQTIAFFLSGFQGRVRIQASLDSSPTTDAQWFQISDVDSTAKTLQEINVDEEDIFAQQEQKFRETEDTWSKLKAEFDAYKASHP